MAVKEFAEGTRMVGLAVVDHHEIDPLRPQLLQLFQEIAGKGRLYRIDEGGFPLPPHKVGIVGGTVAGWKKFVKDLELWVLGADPVQTGANLDNAGHEISFG